MLYKKVNVCFFYFYVKDFYFYYDDVLYEMRKVWYEEIETYVYE